MSEPIILATRKSPLALRQTEMVGAWLKERLGGTTIEELRLSTSGDERLKWSLEKEGGKGLFTRELESALFDKRATLAVHSAKDLPTAFEPGLAIAGYLPRARPNDIFVHHEAQSAPQVIATSSPRRRAQIARLYPAAKWTTIRGNVATRMRKIAEGEADATLLAAAGLDRLGIASHENLVFRELPIDVVVPAPGQAAIAVQCREEDVERFAPLFCPDTFLAVSLERAFLQRLGGGCQTPVGAHYTKGALLIYHPNTGHVRCELEIASTGEIEAALDRIFEQHNFETAG